MNQTPAAPAPLDEAECCRRLAPAARLYFLRNVGVDTDDLVQEALMLLVAALRSGAVCDSGLAGAYLYGVCKNLSRSSGRKHARRTNLLDRNATLFESEAPPPSVVDGRQLWNCLNRLGARARAIVLQTFVEDCDADEIATALDTTLGNVRVTRHRALAALRTCMTEEPRP